MLMLMLKSVTVLSGAASERRVQDPGSRKPGPGRPGPGPPMDIGGFRMGGFRMGRFRKDGFRTSARKELRKEMKGG